MAAHAESQILLACGGRAVCGWVTVDSLFCLLVGEGCRTVVDDASGDGAGSVAFMAGSTCERGATGGEERTGGGYVCP